MQLLRRLYLEIKKLLFVAYGAGRTHLELNQPKSHFWQI